MPLVQLRDKDASTEERVALARRLKPICANYGAVVINDDVKAAYISDVDGVHEGKGIWMSLWRVRLSGQIR